MWKYNRNTRMTLFEVPPVLTNLVRLVEVSLVVPSCRAADAAGEEPRERRQCRRVPLERPLRGLHPCEQLRLDCLKLAGEGPLVGLHGHVALPLLEARGGRRLAAAAIAKVRVTARADQRRIRTRGDDAGCELGVITD